MAATMAISVIPVPGRAVSDGREKGSGSMDWHAWLLRTTLDPATAREYGLLFARNELEEEDIVHFDHEFLLSMGVSVAKHRLEILKLAKRERRRPVPRLVAAAHRTKRCLVRCLRSLAEGIGGRRSSSALVPVRWRSQLGLGGAGWWGWKPAALRQGRLMATSGGGSRRHFFGKPPPQRSPRGRKGKGVRDGAVRDGAAEDGAVRWDAMFGDLKPT